MTDELHDDAMKRKRLTARLISEAHGKLMETTWANPNDYPVYLDYESTVLLRGIQREVAAILAKHEEAEKELQNGTTT